MLPLVVLIVAALVAPFAARSSAAGDADRTRPVVLAGDAVPGGGTFERFSVESLPIVAPVTSEGRVAFFATILRGRASEGFFVWSEGKVAKVVVDGDPSPAGGTFSGFGRHPIPALNAHGRLAFAAAVAGGKTVEGIFLATGRTVKTVAVTGGAAPGVPSGVLASVDAPSLNDRGDVAFLATVRRGRESLEAIYVASAGKLRKVVAQGDAAPAGGVFAGFGAPVVNAKGIVAFAAVVEGPAVPGGLFVSEDGKIRMVLGAGDDAPIGGIFAKLSERIAFNDTGAIAFNAVLKRGPVAAGIFVVEGDRVRKVAALGDPAPGGGVFSYLGLWPALSATGTVGFVASVDHGPAPIGVFTADRSETRKIAGVGDTVVGVGRLASFGLYPTMAISGTRAVTVAIARDSGGAGVDGIVLVPPPP